MDEFARLELLQKYPRYSEYLTDDMSYYPDFEPESLFVAEVNGQVVGALLGANGYEGALSKSISVRYAGDCCCD